MAVGPEVEFDDFYESPGLHVIRDGSDAADGDGDTGMVFLHGFAQNADCAGPFVDMLTSACAVRAVDLPGHRSRPWGSAMGSPFWRTADGLATAVGTADYIGYSMGGRIALHVALAHPTSVRRLVLIGATAGIEDPDERMERRRSDEALAARLENIGLRRFLDEWLAQPLFERLSGPATQLEHRLENTVEGLAWSLRNMGTGSMEPLWGRLGAITCPVLVIAGGHDARYCELASRLVRALGGDAQLAIVEGAGHSVHLEAPDQTARIVSDFIADTRDRTA